MEQGHSIDSGASEFTFFQLTLKGADWDQYVLLDNQSTCHVFKNTDLLTDIQPALHPIAIHSTAGISYADSVGYIPNFPDPIYFCKRGIANILSFAKVREAGCAITYDTDNDAFIVQVPIRDIVFTRLLSGL